MGRRWVYGLLLLAICSSGVSLTRAQDQVDVSAVVCDPGTMVPPTIVSPLSGTIVTTASLTVAGTGNIGEIVTLYRNGVLAGTTNVSGDATWSTTISLVPGANFIETLNCRGAASVTVTYDAPEPPPTPPLTPPPASLPAPVPSAPGQPPRAPTDVAVAPPVGTVPVPLQRPSPVTIPPNSFYPTTASGTISILKNESARIAFTAHDGHAPLHIHIDWGDGEHGRESAASGVVELQHRYDQPGTYRVIVTVIDNAGRVAVMSYVVKVRQSAETIGAAETARVPTALPLVIALELLLAMLLFSAWEYLHERRENSGLY